MESVFLVCFLVGFCMTIASLVLGVGHIGGIHIGHGGHLGGHALGHGSGGQDSAGHTGVPTHASGSSVGYLNLTTAMTFVTWFGGVGYLISHYTILGGVVSLVAAVASGLGGGTIVTLFITKVLEKGQTGELQESDYAMSGTVAHVSSTIYPGYAGEVIYTLAGTRQSAAARSISGEEMPRGTEVVILKYENGTAYVDTWEHALDEGSDVRALHS